MSTTAQTGGSSGGPDNAGDSTQPMHSIKRKPSSPQLDDITPQKKAKQEENEDAVVHLDIDGLKIHADFWYPDGNVVLVVDGSVFKLYKARLARYSTVFDSMFTVDGERRAQYEGSPCYRLPEDIKSDDFVAFLEALETPFKYANKLPQQGTAISLLRVSRLLDCSTACALALDLLHKLWPHEKPTLSVPSKCRFSDALKILKVSRECAVPTLRKRAFYELLRSAAFWKAVADNRRGLGLADEDLFALFSARNALQQRWSALIFTWPYPGNEMCPGQGVQGSRTCNPRLLKLHLRRAIWRADIIESKDYEAGIQDPIGWLGVLVNKKDFSGQGWCETCLKERRTAWLEAQTSWWAMLDSWFDLS
ncbi:hypothetical protein TRAPUB_1312 [Trametes pubescens]|uniref:BTB domain-containing protein n=1 Tax=Trametes pubescens TaxID=154538 RepID=A0A1M2VJR0_TRAPU|nr:hypothetical protein TRAPUB_1312 [Trametes pubescens]